MKTADFERVMPEHFRIEEIKLRKGQVVVCVATNLRDNPNPAMVMFNAKGQCFAIDDSAYCKFEEIEEEGRWPEEDLNFNTGQP